MDNITVKPALVLDLDGTVRRSKFGDFIKSVDDIEIIPGIKEAINAYKERGFLICAATNQGGCAYGYKTVEGVKAEIKATDDMLDNVFDVIAVCYAHPLGKEETGYKYESLFRKPNYGMLAHIEWEALNNHIQIDWKKSVMVGDMDTDKQCARSAGVYYYDVKHFLEKEWILNEANKDQGCQCDVDECEAPYCTYFKIKHVPKL